jgi:hypothetical protein
MIVLWREVSKNRGRDLLINLDMFACISDTLIIPFVTSVRISTTVREAPINLNYGRISKHIHSTVKTRKKNIPPRMMETGEEKQTYRTK